MLKTELKLFTYLQKNDADHVENAAETPNLQKNDADHVENAAETRDLQKNDDAIHSKNQAVP